jgi:predicted O-methyltransferase YrrM
MINSYEGVLGWIGDETTRLFDIAINNINNSAIFVELGTYRGKSSICLYDKIIESNKNITLYTIDNFSQSLPHDDINTDNKSIFMENIGTRNINLIDSDWIDSLNYFDNDGIDFLFIDINETGDGLLKLINLWLPKIKNNGIISGHDYHWDNIKSVVDKKFPNRKVIIENKINVAEFEFQPNEWSHHVWYVKL